jgi:hypothetical protein
MQLQFRTYAKNNEQTKTKEKRKYKKFSLPLGLA